tara:strand:+ start:6239 stop:8125 length:1887 start_codon:yes stop_codon:yes gene_type:complete
MKISAKTIDEIFNTVVIEDVISEFVALKKTGANYKGLSPFNEEKTPSFVVSPAKEIWKDFSSGKGGNVISFLMEHEQYTYPDALLFLAKKYNINVEYVELDAKAQEKENERQATVLVLNFSKDFFKNTLQSKKNKALMYLEGRGFLKSTIELFEIGYCDRLDNKLALEAKKNGYNLKYLHATKIINENESTRFSDRVIFPIHNLNGDVVGFGARVLNDHGKSPKYLNSDSSELYQKSKILYGLHLAKKEIKKLDLCYIVEGYTDVMSLSQFGIKNVVSSCGTAITKDQLRLIHRFTDNICILFDSDDAGVNATLKAIDMSLKEGLRPKILQLPTGEDPSSFLQKENIETINNYIKINKQDFIEFKYALLQGGDDEEMIKLAKEIVSSISLISDTISQSFYIKKASKILDISQEHLVQALDFQVGLRAKMPPKKTLKKEVNKESNTVLSREFLQKNHREEMHLARLLINYGTTKTLLINSSNITLAGFIIMELEKDSRDINTTFTVPIFNDILNAIKEKIKSGEGFSKDDFLNHENLKFREISALLIGDSHFLSNWEDKDIIVVQEEDILAKVTKESILRFKLKRVQEILKALLLQLKEGEHNNESIIKQFSQLSQVEKKIQKKLGRLA